MLTSLGARTITVRRARPSRARWTFSEASASSRRSSSEMSGETSSRSRTLPCTWTTAVTVSSTSSASSCVGQPALATDAGCPRTFHRSSAVYGANKLRMTATASTASRTAGSAPPAPLAASMVLRVALTSSISFATTTLNLLLSNRACASAIVRWVTVRSARSPVAASTPGALVTSWPRRQARARNLAEPDGDTSAQSTSSSGGEAKTMVSRTASTPYLSSCSPRSTPLPSDLLMALPPLSTWPWLSRALNGSSASIMPRSWMTLVKKRAYSRCRMACSTPPTYWPTGIQSLILAGSNGPSVYCGETKRRKYQDESTKVSMVSVSRLAGPWQLGHSTLTQASAAASGDVPFGDRSSPRRFSGRVTGSCSSGTGTSPQAGQ